MKPRLLDLFCGAGGAAMGYHRAGFEVVGVDNHGQPDYPFAFVNRDAIGVMKQLLYGLSVLDTSGIEWNLDQFDAIHASPPCQAYSMMQHIRKNRNEHADLVQETRELLMQTGKRYVIENVYRSPLRATLMLCGSMFGLRIIRHRYFESNSLPMLLMPPCNHSDVYDHWHTKGNPRNSNEFREAMGIDWMRDAGGGRRSGTVSQAIPPAYTEFIGKQLMQYITRTHHANTATPLLLS